LNQTIKPYSIKYFKLKEKPKATKQITLDRWIDLTIWQAFKKMNLYAQKPIFSEINDSDRGI